MKQSPTIDLNKTLLRLLRSAEVTAQYPPTEWQGLPGGQHEDELVLIGATTDDRKALSEHSLTGETECEAALSPKLSLADTPNYRFVALLVSKGLISYALPVTKGGIAVTLANLALNTNKQLYVDLENWQFTNIPDAGPKKERLSLRAFLFSEAPDRFIISCSDQDQIYSLAQEKAVTISFLGTGRLAGPGHVEDNDTDIWGGDDFLLWDDVSDTGIDMTLTGVREALLRSS